MVALANVPPRREGQVRIIDALGVEDEILPFQYRITSYGADYPVELLVRRMEDGEIFNPPFQRGYVWDMKMASRFVESLLLGLPVPGIFLSKEPESQTHLIIDGQQRLRTLQHFFRGTFPGSDRIFSLSGVQTHFRGLTYRDLAPEDRRRLNDSIIHCTIIRQDEPGEDQSSIYHIFERLNSGGKLLAPQEIRSALFHGDLVEVVRELNKDEAWRAIFGPTHAQQRDQELIVRFLAFYFHEASYEAPMKTFLNRYMGRNRMLQAQSADEVRKVFYSAIHIAFETFGTAAFKPQGALNAAVFDSVMVGLARRLSRGSIQDLVGLQQRYQELLVDPMFVSGSTKATANRQRVAERFGAATRVFQDAR